MRYDQETCQHPEQAVSCHWPLQHRRHHDQRLWSDKPLCPGTDPGAAVVALLDLGDRIQPSSLDWKARAVNAEHAREAMLCSLCYCLRISRYNVSMTPWPEPTRPNPFALRTEQVLGPESVYTHLPYSRRWRSSTHRRVPTAYQQELSNWPGQSMYHSDEQVFCRCPQQIWLVSTKFLRCEVASRRGQARRTAIHLPTSPTTALASPISLSSKSSLSKTPCQA